MADELTDAEAGGLDISNPAMVRQSADQEDGADPHEAEDQPHDSLPA